MIAKNKQVVFAKVLSDIGKVFNTLGIKYHLGWGTALGARRERQFIDHDYDIDLKIMRQHYNLSARKAMHKIGIRMLKENGFCKGGTLGTLEDGLEHQFIHELDVRVDINIVYQRDDGWYSASYFGICDKFPGGKCWYRVSPYELELMAFAGGKYWVPEENYLVENYGPDWQISKKFKYCDESILTQYPSLVDQEMIT